MKIEWENRSKAVLVRVVGRMDAVTAPEFDQACTKLIAEGANHLVVDLGQMDYISSAGLRSILTTGKMLKSRGGDLLLCNMKGMVKEIFEISGFLPIFPLYPTPDEAFARL